MEKCIVLISAQMLKSPPGSENLIIEQAVANALETLGESLTLAEGADGRRDDGAPPANAISGSAPAQRLEAVIRAWNWSVNDVESEAPPRPMARLAEADPVRRRIVLFSPYLRYLAASAGIAASPPLAPEWEGELSRLAGEPWRRLAPANRESWLRAAALAHELFHLFDCEAEAELESEGKSEGKSEEKSSKIKGCSPNSLESPRETDARRRLRQRPLWPAGASPSPAQIERAAESFAWRALGSISGQAK